MFSRIKNVFRKETPEPAPAPAPEPVDTVKEQAEPEQTEQTEQTELALAQDALILAESIIHSLNVSLAVAQEKADHNYREGALTISALLLALGGETTLSEDMINAAYGQRVEYQAHPDGSVTMKFSEEQPEETESE